MSSEHIPWLAFFVHLFQALSTTIIAGLVGYVAYRQHRLDTTKFKWELYDRRLKAYMVVKRLTAQTMITGDFPVHDSAEMESLRVAMWESNFLFGEKIANYMKQFFDNGAHLAVHMRELNNERVSETRRAEILPQREMLFRWFVDQSDAQTQLFAQFLRIH